MGSVSGRRIEELLGPLATDVIAGRPAAVADHARLLARDTTLWPGGERANAPWLGWLDAAARAPEHIERITRLVVEVRAAGVTDVVLTGMGGSSLFPEVLSRVFGVAPGYPRLWVIDSTDPAAVLRVEEEVPWASTLVVAASKSGGTVETRAHLARFRARLEDALGDGAARRIVVITDPGSTLEDLAEQERFLAIVHGDPDVGGRFSALSPFGLLPAALIGVDPTDLIARAAQAADRFAADPWSDAGPALLATSLAEAHRTGRFALHLLLPEDSGGLGLWIEQLVAESTGKAGVGVLPVLSRNALDVRPDPRRVVVALGEHPGLDRLVAAGVPVLTIPWPGAEGLAIEIVRWMQAVALLCARLAVDPFDQPDVASAKAATSRMLDGGAELDRPVVLQAVLDDLGAADHLVVLAFVDPHGAIGAQLEDACGRLARELDVPVTLGIGPRYLHSTGQLHKGGRAGGRYVIVVGADPCDAEVPGQDYTFSRLKHAQAAGDLAALRAAGRRVDVVELSTFLDDAAGERQAF
jgi:transaldolase/glucose-6-phosphate isomerase